MVLSLEEKTFFHNVLDSRDPCKSIPRFLRDSISGELITLAEIHKQIQNHITEHQYSLIVMSRDHGKSSQVAVGRTAHEIGNNPHVRGGIFSESTDVAQDRVEAVGDHIQREEYQELYPDIYPDRNCWGRKSLKVKRGYVITDPTLYGIGIRSAITGHRLDWLVEDDVCGEECQTSRALREEVKRKHHNTVMNLLEPDGKAVYIGTFWHKHDLTSELFDGAPDNGWAPLMIGINDNHDPIWEEKWDRANLLKKRKQNIRAYELGFQLKCRATEDIVFNEEDLKACISIGDPVVMERIDTNWIRVMGIDLASREKTSADYTVIMVWAVNPENGLWVPIDLVRKKMTGPDTVKTIIKLQDRWNCDLITVENNQYQETCVQWTKETSIKGIPIEGEPSIKDKITKANVLSVDFNHRKIRIWMHQNPLLPNCKDPSCDCAWCIWIKEMKDFPDGEHDDTIDGAWFARVGINKLLGIYKRKKRKVGEISLRI